MSEFLFQDGGLIVVIVALVFLSVVVFALASERRAELEYFRQMKERQCPHRFAKMVYVVGKDKRLETNFVCGGCGRTVEAVVTKVEEGGE